MTIGLTERLVRLNKKERLRFLQGALFGANLTACGHSQAEIVERTFAVAEAWGITRIEFESSFDDLLEEIAIN